jgi:hypothetical protein
VTVDSRFRVRATVDGVPRWMSAVPCDDAAVERAALALAARRDPEYQIVEPDDFEDARTALRAAGELS